MNDSRQLTDWSCPSLENRKIMQRPNPAKLASFSDISFVISMMEEERRYAPDEPYILPVWQNLESIVLSGKLSGDGSYMTPGQYCLKDLRILEHKNLSILEDPMIETLLQVIGRYKNQPLILEMEAAFSILASLMDPMELYQTFTSQGELLLKILHRIADAQAEYLSAAIHAGVRVISLADPMGTMNLIGEDYYRQYCGEASHYFLQKIRPMLSHSIVHLCKKMSQSLLLTGYIQVEPYSTWKRSAGNNYDCLISMADNKEIAFTGMTCIHHKKKDLGESYVLFCK